MANSLAATDDWWIGSIDPTAVSACLVGYKQARAIGHATAPRFAEALTALEPTLAPAHRDYLEAPHVGY